MTDFGRRLAKLERVEAPPRYPRYIRLIEIDGVRTAMDGGPVPPLGPNERYLIRVIVDPPCRRCASDAGEARNAG